MTDHLDASPPFDLDPMLHPLVARWVERRVGARRELEAQPAVDTAQLMARLRERIADERAPHGRGRGVSPTCPAPHPASS